MVQNDKKFCLSRSISQEPYMIWFSFLGTKNVPKNGKLYLSCTISQGPYIIRSSFVIHKCKMIISPSIFLIFSKFWFFVLLGRSKGKKLWQKKNKLCSSCLLSQEPYIVWSSFMVHICKIIISPGAFYTFSKF